jgi:hypothetical protein
VGYKVKYDLSSQRPLLQGADFVLVLDTQFVLFAVKRRKHDNSSKVKTVQEMKG